MTRLATLRTNVEVNGTGETYERPDWIEDSRRGIRPGQRSTGVGRGEDAIAKRPSDASRRNTGNSAVWSARRIYSLQYGDYLHRTNPREPFLQLHVRRDTERRPIW